jgi:beta-barrel assembly-enhancing protease
MKCRLSACFSGRYRACAAALAVSLACAPAPGGRVMAQNLPNLGDESANVLSPQMERRIGEGYFRELRRDPDFLDDPEVTAYVQDLGNRLLAASPDPTLDVEFFMIKDPTINAFAMIGGYIGVNSGLLLAAQSESEVASVLGHELGHLIQKHLARSVSASQKTSMVVLAAALACILASARSNSGAAQACAVAGAGVPIAQQLAYSRDFEREADRVGFDILQKGGFDVSAMPLFFERLQRAGQVYDSNAPAYMRSHPLTTERIADVRNRAQNVPYRQHVDPLTFHLVRAKLRATVASTSADGRLEALTFFSSQLANRAYANLAAAHYGYAVALAQARDYAAAEAQLAQIPKTVTHPMIDSLAASLLLARHDVAGAINAYRAAVAKYPRSRSLQLALIDALQQANRHDEALAMLREQALLYRGDPKVFEMQAKSYAATGKNMAQHQAQAEVHALLGRLQPAIDELISARCSRDGDFYQQSIIDARIHTLWDELAQQREDEINAKSGGDAAKGGRTRPMISGKAPEARCSG